MILHQMIVRRVDYRKKERKRMINKGILDWVRNPSWDSIWIKELPILYYSVSTTFIKPSLVSSSKDWMLPINSLSLLGFLVQGDFTARGTKETTL